MARLRPTAILRILVPALALLLIAGCGDDDKGGGGTTLTAPVADLTGTWSITEMVDDTGCGGSTYQTGYQAVVTQNGNSLTVVINGMTFNGTISGNRAWWTGSYPDQGGTTTITSMNLTVNNDGDALSGTAAWSWSDGAMSCTGTTQVGGVLN